MDVVEILKKAIKENASDIFFVAGSPCMLKVGQQLVAITQEKMMPNDTKNIALHLIVHMRILKKMGKMIFRFRYHK